MHLRLQINGLDEINAIEFPSECPTVNSISAGERAYLFVHSVVSHVRDGLPYHLKAIVNPHVCELCGIVDIIPGTFQGM
jgi:hypothetical protein